MKYRRPSKVKHLFVGCDVASIMLVQVVGVCSSDALGLVTSLGADALDYTDPATKDVLRTDGR